MPFSHGLFLSVTPPGASLLSGRVRGPSVCGCVVSGCKCHSCLSTRPLMGTRRCPDLAVVNSAAVQWGASSSGVGAPAAPFAAWLLEKLGESWVSVSLRAKAVCSVESLRAFLPHTTETAHFLWPRSGGGWRCPQPRGELTEVADGPGGGRPDETQRGTHSPRYLNWGVTRSAWGGSEGTGVSLEPGRIWRQGRRAIASRGQRGKGQARPRRGACRGHVANGR